MQGFLQVQDSATNQQTKVTVSQRTNLISLIVNLRCEAAGWFEGIAIFHTEVFNNLALCTQEKLRLAISIIITPIREKLKDKESKLTVLRF